MRAVKALAHPQPVRGERRLSAGSSHGGRRRALRGPADPRRGCLGTTS